MGSKLTTQFSRNVDLEQSIDIKLMGKSLISLFTYMNAINRHLEVEVQLSKTLQIAPIHQYYKQLDNPELSQEECQYLSELLSYIDKLVNQSNAPNRYRYRDVCDIIVKSMEDDLKSEEILKNLLTELQSYKGFVVYKINCGDDNIGFNIYNWEKRIFIIINPDTFIADNNHQRTDIFVKNAEKLPESIIENKLCLESIIYIEEGECIVNRSFIYKAVMKLEDLKRYLDSNDTVNLYDKVTGLIDQLKCLELCTSVNRPIYNESFLTTNIGEVESIRRRLAKISGGIEEKLHKHKQHSLTLVKYINRDLSLWLACAEQYKGIANSIEFSLAEIRRNNVLNLLSGQERKYETAFNEENLSGILASNLRCIYRDYNFINIATEIWTGLGRSDVRISINQKTVAIIESKLLFTINYRHKEAKVLKNYNGKTKEGLNQLFKRYSEYESLNDSNAIELYLALFTYDADMYNLTHKVLEAVEEYAKENQFTYTLLDCGTNSLNFTYTSHRGLKDKQSHITVYLCNLELNYKNSK